MARRGFAPKDYMDPFINPRDNLAAAAKELDEKRREPKPFPEQPERDVLLFLLEHAPLNAWQADVLSIIRDEAYYFAPQAQTKIMNEGWASYWHSTIMTRQGLDAGRRDQLLRPPHRHAGQLADAAQPLQARHRAVPRHRGPLEPRRVRQGVRRVRRLPATAATGTPTPAWAARRSSRSAASTTI